MKIPPKALANVKESLKALDALEPGKALHYCIVRVGGADDETPRVVFGDTASQATKETFARVWSTDEDVSGSERPKWQIARGAFVATSEGGFKTYPALRANHMLAPADVKQEVKKLRETLSDSGVQVGPLKKIVSGKFERAADTAKFDGAGVEDTEVDDEADMKADGADARDDVKAMVDRFKKIPLRATVTAGKDAKTDEEKRLAKEQAAAVRTDLATLEKDAGALAAKLRDKVFGSKRYKDSLKALDEIVTRCKAGERTLEAELGFVFAADAADADHGVKTAKQDEIIKTIRELVGKVNGAKDKARIRALGDLYFATDMWLKAAGRGSTKRAPGHDVDVKLLPKVEEVFTKTAKELAKLAGVQINGLPSWLEANYAKGMEQHGTKLDVQEGWARWMTENQRDLYRCHVSGGKLYQYTWWDWDDDMVFNAKGPLPLGLLPMVPVESSAMPSPGIISDGYTGFVMSMGGDIYIRHQAPADKGRSIYHSSYMAGLPVKMAGELLVKGGVVEVVNAGSGHYRPGRAMIVQFLKTLKTAGVNVKAVGDFRDPLARTPVDEYLRDHGDEEADADEYRRNDEEMAKFRHKVFFDQMFTEQRALIKQAKDACNALAHNCTSFEEAVDRVVYATAPQTISKYERQEREARRTRPTCIDTATTERRSGLLAKQQLEKLLSERNKNHAELVKKDVAPQPDRDDGYVVAIEGLIAEVDAIVSEIDRLLVRASVEPVRPPTTAPWNFKHHGKLDRSGAEALLLKDGDWLLRESSNAGDWVVSYRKVDELKHDTLGDTDRTAFVRKYPENQCVKP